MHIVMHAFGKITLFFGAGAILVAAHKTEVSQLDGLGRRMPLTFTAFTLGTLEYYRITTPGWHVEQMVSGSGHPGDW